MSFSPSRAMLVFSVLAALASMAAAGERFSFFEPSNPSRGFQVVAAGGQAEIAPANTRSAVERAIEDGLEWARVDIRLTSDGRHVLLAEAMLEAHTDGHGAVNNHTLAELKQLDAGGWFAHRFAGTKVLALDECLALAKGKINLVLDCHEVEPARLVAAIRSAGMERQVAVLAGRPTLERVAAAAGDSIGLVARWRRDDGLDGWVEKLHPAIVAIDFDDTRPEICRAFHERGARVYAAMSPDRDRPEVWDAALSAGVDLLETGVPEELIAQVLSSRLKDRHTRFACHRGASRYAPENTLPAFAKAHRLGADFVEFDVRPSCEGHYYLLHDSRLDRTTTGKGSIREASDETIAKLDAGSWFANRFAGTHVPTLDAFLDAVPKGQGLYFDAKDIPPSALAAALKSHGLVEQAIVYQGAGYLAELRQVDADIRRMPPASSIEQVTRLAEKVKPFAVDTPWRALSQAYIDHCHAAGVQVFSDAPGSANLDSYRQAMAWGIDLIQTDFPLRYWRALELERASAGRSVR